MTNRATPLIERYAAGGPILLYAVAGLEPEHETAKPGPGAWSLLELAGHLLDSDLVFADRMKRVIAEENPRLEAFDENAWLAKLDTRGATVGEAVELLAANRRWVTRVLRGCAEGDFARGGAHSERGRVTLAELLSYATNHIDHHLRFLYAKRANLGIALPPRYASEALAS